MKARISILFLFLLTACPQPLPPSAYTPANPDFHKELSESYFLKGKLAIGDVHNSFAPKDIITGPAYAEALRNIFGKAGMLSSGEPSYILNADIVDYRWPDSGFTHVKAGTAVTYSLLRAKSSEEVYRTTITATQDEKKGFFQDAAPVFVRSVAIALGENAAQAVRTFSRLKASDLHASKTSTATSSDGEKP